MSKNLQVVDIAPKNQQVLDVTPQNEEFLTDFGTEQLFPMTLGKGQWTGFYNLTYPVAISIISPKTP